MPKQKLIKLLFLFLALTSLWPVGCSKRFEEDPKSVRWIRFHKRLLGKWELINLTVNGVDSTHLVYVDSLKIYKYWHLINIEKKYNSKTVSTSKRSAYDINFEIMTHNRALIIDRSKMLLIIDLETLMSDKTTKK